MVKGSLEVLLVEGQDIKYPDNKLLDCLCCGLNLWTPMKMHPYILIQCGNQELTSEVANREGKKLIWNQKLILNLEYLEGEHKLYKKLVLRVMDKHKISSNDFIGEATIYITDILSLGEEKGNTELGTQKYRVILPDKTYSGEISVAVNFTVDV